MTEGQVKIVIGKHKLFNVGGSSHYLTVEYYSSSVVSVVSKWVFPIQYILVLSNKLRYF